MTTAAGGGESSSDPESEAGRALEEQAPRESAPDPEPEVFDPEVVDEVVQELVVRVASHFRFRGPLPSPDVLHGYEQVLPGAADRVISMAERQSAHRITMERRTLESLITARARGQFFGLLIALAAIGAGTALILSGKEAGGLATIIVAIGGIVSAFVLGALKKPGKTSRRNDEGGSDEGGSDHAAS